MMSENVFMPVLIRQVLSTVNTARNKPDAKIRGVMSKTETSIAQGERLRAYRKLAGYDSASEAARSHGWVVPTLVSHENGTRQMGVDDAVKYAAGLSRHGIKISAEDILFGAAQRRAEDGAAGINVIPVVGRIGAGATVEPEYEQVPPDGLFEVELPHIVPSGLVAFQVVGDSMVPRYDEGDVILVWKDQRRPLDSFYGQEAAVRTDDGRRFLKTIFHGKTRSVVNLHSFNAKMIEGVKLEWIGEIYSTIRADQVQRTHRRAVMKPRRGAKKEVRK